MEHQKKGRRYGLHDVGIDDMFKRNKIHPAQGKVMSTIRRRRQLEEQRENG